MLRALKIKIRIVAKKQAIPAKINIGLYDNISSLAIPAVEAETAAPYWWAANIQPNITGPFTLPKNFDVNLTVGGTVAIKSSPKKIAHRVKA